MISSKPHILVEVDSIYNDKVDSKLTNEKGEKIEFYFDPSFEPYKYVKTKAKVVGVPSEYISDILTAKQNNFPRSREDKIVFYTAKDFPKLDLKVGDTAYFHYLSLRPDTEEQLSLSYVKDGVHKVNNKELHCYVRDGEITMVFGNVLISAMWDNSVEDVKVDGNNIKCKMSEGGLVVSVGEEALLSVGKVAHINPTEFELSRRELKKGDTVLYMRNSQFKNTIEDEEYYLMKEWNLIAKLEDDKYMPLHDFITIEEKKKKKSILITEGYIEEETLKTGVVTNVGANCDDVSVGDTVMFNTKTPLCIEHEHLFFVNKTEVIAHVEQ